jgi:hypothetical protein
MEHQVLPAHFDRSKPFYPLVVQYTVQLLGFRGLAARALAGGRAGGLTVAAVTGLGESFYPATPAEAAELAKLLGPLELASSVQTDRVLLNAEEIANEIAANVKYLSRYLLLAAGNVLVLAHELCKDKPAHDQSLLWEFLRHCRNAAAHGGLFNLHGGEPYRPARWRTLEILPGLQGSPLFVGEDGRGLLRPADPVLLLWDIEQAYPALA